MNVLLIEDNQKISDFIKDEMTNDGHNTEIASDGKMGCELSLSNKYDIIILDLMLPEMDGFQVLKILKDKGIITPIIILSAKHTVEEKVKCLNIGADDYMVKPFSFAELMARINALLRRASEQNIRYKNIVLDRYNRKVYFNDLSTELQPKESLLLEILINQDGRPLSKNYILDKVWNINFDPGTNVVDVLVCRLRNKLEYTFGKRFITTVRGMGYMLQDD